jgi:hypothetical protein
MRGEDVSWENCEYNISQENNPIKFSQLQKFIDSCVIYPSGKRQMPLRKWFDEKTF